MKVKKMHVCLVMIIMMCGWTSCQNEFDTDNIDPDAELVDNPYAMDVKDAVAGTNVFMSRMAEGEESVTLRNFPFELQDYEVQTTTHQVFIPVPSKLGARQAKQSVPVYTIHYKNRSGQPAGSVVTIGDDRVEEKVIAFSETQQLDLFSGDQADFFRDRVAGYIFHTTARSGLAEKKLLEQMNLRALEDQEVYVVSGYDAVAKKWHQSAPFNRFVPFKSGVKAKVGCVAIAMGQVMAYHKWPQLGASYFYKESPYVKLWSENYYTAYWDAIQYPTDRNGGEEMAARLLVEIGYKMHMNYGAYVSRANHEWGCVPVFNQMGYFCDNGFVKYDYSVLLQKILVDIKNNRPVIMYGADEKKIEAHLFVITGFLPVKRSGLVEHNSNLSIYIYVRNGHLGINDGWYHNSIFSATQTSESVFDPFYLYRFSCSVLCNIRPNPGNRGDKYREFRYSLPYPYQPAEF